MKTLQLNAIVSCLSCAKALLCGLLEIFITFSTLCIGAKEAKKKPQSEIRHTTCKHIEMKRKLLQ